jgi:hypothetical protein
VIQLEDRVRVLEEALRPFAQYAAQMRKAWGPLYDSDSVFYGVKRDDAHQMKYADFRRAAEAMGL